MEMHSPVYVFSVMQLAIMHVTFYAVMHVFIPQSCWVTLSKN